METYAKEVIELTGFGNKEINGTYFVRYRGEDSVIYRKNNWIYILFTSSMLPYSSDTGFFIIKSTKFHDAIPMDDVLYFTTLSEIVDGKLTWHGTSSSKTYANAVGEENIYNESSSSSTQSSLSESTDSASDSSFGYSSSTSSSSSLSTKSQSSDSSSSTLSSLTSNSNSSELNSFSSQSLSSLSLQSEDSSSSSFIDHQKRRALVVGINQYIWTGININGPVEGAIYWENYLKSYTGRNAIEVTTMYNFVATLAAVQSKWVELTEDMVAGDSFTFYFGGHGTRSADGSGDETDALDEGRVFYDAVWYDDGIRAYIDAIPEGVNVTIIYDSCYAGTGTRAFITEPPINELTEFGTPVAHRIPQLPIELRTRPKAEGSEFMTKATLAEEDMKEVLIASSQEGELSWTYSYSGIFTIYAMAILNNYNQNHDLTYAQFYNLLTTVYHWPIYSTQVPQIEGSTANKSRVMFS